MKRLKLKLREQEEANRRLSQVNAVLETQVASAVRNNEALARDARRLGQNWEELRKEQEEKVRKKNKLPR